MGLIDNNIYANEANPQEEEEPTLLLPPPPPLSINSYILNYKEPTEAENNEHPTVVDQQFFIAGDGPEQDNFKDEAYHYQSNFLGWSNPYTSHFPPTNSYAPLNYQQNQEFVHPPHHPHPPPHHHNHHHEHPHPPPHHHGHHHEHPHPPPHHHGHHHEHPHPPHGHHPHPPPNHHGHHHPHPPPHHHGHHHGHHPHPPPHHHGHHYQPHPCPPPHHHGHHHGHHQPHPCPPPHHHKDDIEDTDLQIQHKTIHTYVATQMAVNEEEMKSMDFAMALLLFVMGFFLIVPWYFSFIYWRSKCRATRYLSIISSFLAFMVTCVVLAFLITCWINFGGDGVFY